jgi:hypothetical protein
MSDLFLHKQGENEMTKHTIGTRAQWAAAREELLAREKEHTRRTSPREAPASLGLTGSPRSASVERQGCALPAAPGTAPALLLGPVFVLPRI